MQIFWVELSKIIYKDFFNEIINSKKQLKIYTPNPQILLEAKNDTNYSKILNLADYLLPDWIWIYFAYKILDNKYWKIINIILFPYYLFKIFFTKQGLYKKYWERVCGSDLTKDLLNYANKNNLWVTIIDLSFKLITKWDYEKFENQKIMVAKLNEKYPNISFHHYIYNNESREEIINKINNTNDVYLFSTLWVKNQEESIEYILPKTPNIKIATWIGWSLDFITWFKKRAPKKIVNLWLEWLWRFFYEPKRMWKRIWISIPVFLFEVFKEK
jgi:N-acetylglucosaminyldiphosphoundecaprenol N-acetyl-beta-D-mannosaminyltransferase